MARRTILPTLATVLSSSSIIFRARAADPPRCYWPDGSIDNSPSVRPCNATASDLGPGASACCLHDDACYDSGTCFQSWSGIMYRQSCTDPTWKSAKCPKTCLDKSGGGENPLSSLLFLLTAQDDLSIGRWLQTCSLQNAQACCVRDDGSCCNKTSELFTYRPGYISAVINGDGTNRLGPYVNADGVTDAVAPTPSTAISGDDATTSPTGILTSSSGTSHPSTSTADATAAAAAKESSASKSDTEKNSKRLVLGVGIPLAILFAASSAAAAFFGTKYLSARRRRREQQAVAAKVPAPTTRLWPGELPGDRRFLPGGALGGAFGSQGLAGNNGMATMMQQQQQQQQAAGSWGWQPGAELSGVPEPRELPEKRWSVRTGLMSVPPGAAGGGTDAAKMLPSAKRGLTGRDVGKKGGWFGSWS